MAKKNQEVDEPTVKTQKAAKEPTPETAKEPEAPPELPKAVGKTRQVKTVVVATKHVKHGRSVGVRFVLKPGDLLSDVRSYGHATGEGQQLSDAEVANFLKYGQAELKDI